MANPAETRQSNPSRTAHQLRSLLVRLAADRGDLHAKEQPAAGLLSALVREIDEVILPREILLLSDGRIVATVIASNRRLVDLRMTDGSMPPIEGSPDDVARGYAQAICAIQERVGSVTLQRGGRAAQSTTSSSACSAQRLSEVAQTLGQQNLIEKFLNLSQVQAVGWVWHQTAQTGKRKGGAEGVISALERLWAVRSEIQSSKRVSRQLDHSKPSCTALFLAPDVMAVLATDHKDTLLMAIPQDKILSVLSGWESCCKQADKDQRI
ncbi:MAG: hypothetical protein P1U83_10875 [Roseovarius sp.]|nr:hypothetical protein [Roseovarius sp.]